MPKIGIGLSLVTGIINVAVAPLAYIADKLALYFNFAKEDSLDPVYTGHKTVQFGSAGSTSFDGTDDYIDLGNDFEDWIEAPQKTLSIWVKNGGNTDLGIRIFNVGYDDSSAKTGFGLGVDNGTDNVPYYFLRNTSGATLKAEFGSAMDVGRWYHFAFVQDGAKDEAYFYRDGVLEATVSSVGEITQATNQTAKIGKHWDSGTGNYFKGSIANVGIWTRILSLNEIQAVMRKSYSDLGTTEKQSLEGWWGLDTAPTKTLSLDGSGDFIDLGSGFTSALSTSHSWTMWVKFADGQPSGQTRFIGAKDATDTGGSPADQSWYLAIDNAGKIKGNFESGDNDASVYTSSSVFPNGATSWTHIAMTCNHTLYGGSAGDGYGGIRIYANGVLASPLTGTESGDVWDTNFAEVAYVVNAMVGGQSIMGNSLSSQANTPVDMANLALYGEKLSAADVLTIYGQGITGSLLSVTGITDPINYWVMDDASTLEDLAGTTDASVTNATLVDSLTPDSTDNNSGSINGSTTTVSTYGGHAPKLARTIDVAAETFGDAIGGGNYSFNGSSDYINSSTTSFATSDSLGTVSAWLKSSVTGWNVFFASSDNSGSDFLIFSINTSGTVYVYEKNTGGTTDQVMGNTVITDGEWHYVTFTSSGTAYSIYVDGKPETLTVNSGSNTGDWFGDLVGSDNITIGARDLGSISEYWSGSIAQLGVWGRVLLRSEINSVMEKSYSDLTTADKVDLRGWWGLDVAPVDSVAIDSTGNNNGTLN